MTLCRFPADILWTGASGSPGVNVWHFRSGEDFDLDFDQLSEAVRVFYDTIKGLYTTTTQIKFLGEMTGVGPEVGEVFSADPWTVTGTATNGFMPPSQCMYVNWRAATGGRSGRGRTFLGPCDEFVLESNGTPLEAGRTSVQGAADELISTSEGLTNGAVVIWSRVDSLARDIVSAAVPNQFASLRSRRD